MFFDELLICPTPDSGENSDFVFLYGAGDQYAPHILAYEVARDFLSAPKRFAIIEIRSSTPGAVELDSDNEYEGVIYNEDGSMPALGIFIVQDGVVKDSDSIQGGEAYREQHILISLAVQRIELLADSVTFKQSLIATSAREALGLYLMD